MPEYEIDLRDYWNIFVRRKYIIATVFALTILITFFYISRQPILYRAVGVIKIKPLENITPITQIIRGASSLRPASLYDYERQIVSISIMRKAVKELSIINELCPGEDIDYIVGKLLKNITAKRIEKTNMIAITMVADNQDIASAVVNKVIEIYKEENAKEMNRQARKVREFIEKQLEDVTGRLKEDENKLKTLTLKGIGNLAKSITDEITTLESKRTELLTKYTEAHPDVMEVSKRIQYLKEELSKLPDEEFEYSRLKRDIKINESIYDLLKKKLQEARIRESEVVDNIVVVSPAHPPSKPFKPNKPLSYFMGIIIGLTLGSYLAILREQVDTSVVKIEDVEEIAKCSVIGVIPHWSIPSIEDEILRSRRRIKLKHEKRRREDRPHSKEYRKRRLTWKKKIRKSDKIKIMRYQLCTSEVLQNTPFLEAFRILGANVQILFGEGERIKNKCLLLTSSYPEEGKSIISANLAIVLSQIGYKILLIDADLRRPILHLIFHLREKENGLTDILTGRISAEKATRSTADLLLSDIGQDEVLKNPWIDNLHLITAGTEFPNVPYLLNTEKLNHLLAEVRNKYDIVVVDCSPLLGVSDSSIIAPKTDGVLLVYRAGSTSRIALRRSSKLLSDMRTIDGKSMLKGIILNNVSPELGGASYYYYKSGYYT